MEAHFRQWRERSFDVAVRHRGGGGGGGGGGGAHPCYVSRRRRVIFETSVRLACFSASGMLIYKGCGYSSYKPIDSHCLDRTSNLGRGGGGYV